MKRLFYFAILLSYILWSCSDDDKEIDDLNNPNHPTDITLEISTIDLTFEGSGGQKEFTIFCNSDWTITNNSTWCKTDVTNGNGDKTVIVSTIPYYETQDQNTNLIIKAGDKTMILTVIQKHGDAIILTKDKFDIPQEGKNITIEVKSNIEYQIIIPSEFQSWIKQAVKSKALETKSFSFTISANEDLDKREGYIIFNGNSLKDTVYVYQAQKNQLILTEDTYIIPTAGKDITVELKTNIDYEVTIPDSVNNWISLIQTKTLRTDKLYFSITENKTTENRKAIVIIKDKNSNLSDTIFITQITHKGNITGDVELTTMEEVKEFIGYKKVSGNLTISGFEIKTLTDLSNVLEEITGDLIIDCKNLLNLHGLYGLKYIRGNLILRDAAITSFEGLNNLEEISRDFEISASNTLNQLISFKGLNKLSNIGGDFKINANSIAFFSGGALTALTSFEGLNQLSNIGGSFKINVSALTENYYSYALNNLESFEGLENLAIIGGDFEIITYARNYSSHRDACASPLNKLTSFKGLSKLKSIGGNFKISATSSVTSPAKTSDTVSSLAALSSFDGLENLTTISGNFEISAQASIASFKSYATISSLSALTSFKGLSKLSHIGGNFKINAITSNFSSNSSEYNKSYTYALNNLISFEGLNSLTTISENFEINAEATTHNYSAFNFSSSLNSLTSFQGLSVLNGIGGDFKIKAKAMGSSALNALNSMKGLERLETINGNFEIDAEAYNSVTFSSKPSNALNALTSFQGLNKLSRIGGNFKINTTASNSMAFYSSSNSLNKLESFNGLENLNTIDKSFEINVKVSSETSGAASAYSLNPLSFKGLSKLNIIGENFKVFNSKTGGYSYSLGNLTSFNELNELGSIGGNIIINGCTSLFNFCNLQTVLNNYQGTFTVNDCSYNPTKEQILAGECSKQPE